MSIQLIEAFPKEFRECTEPVSLEVSEFFYDTIQGENFVGYPAAFLRLQGCTLHCAWCDTQEVWRKGNPYGINELVQMIVESPLADKLRNGQHLVVTGGSPLRQQNELIQFVTLLNNTLQFPVVIEIENECTIMPDDELIRFVYIWNNSPKLSSSANGRSSRYKPDVIRKLASLSGSWFKFVIEDETDWQEIQADFLDTGLLRKWQIVLMPLGDTREKVLENAPKVAEMAVKYGVRYTNREHIILWDKKTGV